MDNILYLKQYYAMKISPENQNKVRDIENELFNVELFNNEKTVFPNRVFKKQFDKYYILDTDDWFSSEKEFNKLMQFVKENGEQKIYNTVPSFHNIDGLEFPVKSSYQNYVSEQTFEFEKNNSYNGIGLRMAPEMFYFDPSKKWAIVFDLTNNIFIVGLDNDLNKNFEEKFNGQFNSIEQHLDFLEETNGSKLNNKEEIISYYSQKNFR